MDVVGSIVGVDILFITGIRDKAPVAVFSRLVPNTQLIEVNVEVNEEIWRARQGCSSDGCLLESDRQPETGNATSSTTALDYHPSLTFHNNVKGTAMAEKFA